MNNEEAVRCLFSIGKEVKRSYETPVIFITMKDYANNIFNTLVEMRSILRENATPTQIADIIHNCHIDWLQAVDEVLEIRKRLKDTPRDVLLKSIIFTIDCARKRETHFHEYIKKVESMMSNDEKSVMQSDLKTIAEMRGTATSILREKERYFHYLADQVEFYVKMSDEIKELLNWHDRLNDHLILELCNFLHLRVPQLADLTKTLQDIVDEVAELPNPEAQKIAKEIHRKGRRIGSIIRITNVNELEIRKIFAKIKTLEERINRLKMEKSSALMALQHKTIFLEDRLQSLQNLKESLIVLNTQHSEAHDDSFSDTKKLHIFNHLLPQNQRCRLVEQLVKLWDNALGVDEIKKKSIISILSARDMIQEFVDDVGHFKVDKYGRKLYTHAGDDNFYQLNERNELVPIEDDRHVYFYDECGRYYFNDTRQRIYKSHRSASEYFLRDDGILWKVKEERDGIQYGFDRLGRYYRNELGHKVYYEEDSENEYEHDGLGNLVRIRNYELHYQTFPPEPLSLPDNKYLQQTVGEALKHCLADMITCQPVNPILYLANGLVKYRNNMEARQRNKCDEKEKLKTRNCCQDIPKLSPE